MNDSIQTKAHVRVVLEIDAGTNTWDEKESGLGRAFREAKEHALNTLNRLVQGKGLKGELGKLRVVKIERVDITVSDVGGDES